jgi:hypothetical protein
LAAPALEQATVTAAELLVSLGSPLILGALALLCVGESPRRDLLGWLGAVFPAGALLTSLILLGTMALGMSAQGPAARIAVGGAIFLVGVAAWRRRSRKDSKPEASPGASSPRPPALLRWSGGLVMLTVLVWAVSELVFLDLPTLREPIASGDSASIWTLRAKMLFDHGVIDEGLATTLAESRGAHHLDYPLLNPLLQVWLMGTAGDYLDAELRLPSYLWHLSMIFTLLAATRRWFERGLPGWGQLLGAPLALLYLGLPGIAVVATGTMMDLVVALAFLGFCERVLRLASRVSATPGRNDWAMIALWAGVLVWSKNEGMMLLAAASIAGLLGLPWRRIGQALRTPRLAFLLLPAAVLGAQFLFNRVLEYENDLLTGGHGRDPRSLSQTFVENLPERWGTISSFLGRGAIDFDVSRYLFLVYVAAALLGGRAAWQAPRRFLTLAIPGGYAGYVCAYVISHEDLPWHLYTSAYRTTGQLLPAIVLLLAVLLGESFRKSRAPAPETS